MTQTATRSAETPAFVGQSVPRREDAALITGRATWTDDITPAGTLHMAVLRSPVAHARIRGIDAGPAPRCPAWWPSSPARTWRTSSRSGCPAGGRSPRTSRSPTTRRWPSGEVNHVGDGVAVVLATDPRDGAGGARAGRASTTRSCPPSSTSRPPSSPAPRSCTRSSAPTTATPGRSPSATSTRRSPQADVVVEGRYVQQRVLPSPMETARGRGEPGAVGGGFTVYTSTQVPHFVRDILAADLRRLRQQDARRRPGRRRRLRLQAQRLRRGGARVRPGPAARASR